MLQNRQIALRQDVVRLVDQNQLRLRRFGQPAADRLHHAHGAKGEVYATRREGIGNLLTQLSAVDDEQHPVASFRGTGGDVALDNG